LDVVPVKVNEWEPRHYYVYIASGELGYRSWMPASPCRRRKSVIQYTRDISTVENIGRDAHVHCCIHIGRGEQVPDKVWHQSRHICSISGLRDNIVVLVWVGRTIVLPVESPSDRLEVIRCLFSYLYGTHSAAIAVKEGEVYAGPVSRRERIRR